GGATVPPRQYPRCPLGLSLVPVSLFRSPGGAPGRRPQLAASAAVRPGLWLGGQPSQRPALLASTGTPSREPQRRAGDGGGGRGPRHSHRRADPLPGPGGLAADTRRGSGRRAPGHSPGPDPGGPGDPALGGRYRPGGTGLSPCGVAAMTLAHGGNLAAASIAFGIPRGDW